MNELKVVKLGADGEIEMLCVEESVPASFSLIIFGASGDLTRRKLVPSLYSLFKKGLLPDEFFILGTGRTQKNHEGFREEMKDAVAQVETFDETAWQGFAKKLYYRTLNYKSSTSFNAISDIISELDVIHATPGTRIFYLATPPAAYESIIQGLGASTLSGKGEGYTRIAIEKPFGRDLKSAKELNDLLHWYFREDQIFRIDHYLAKETVQNILLFRFANAIFEPIWNNRYIDHVQITAAETLGVEHRAAYYEKAGVIRDMFQNHMLQLLALVAMEPPAVFDADRVREEKVKVFRSLRPVPVDRLGDYVVLGQYTSGVIDERKVPGYKEEPGVAPDSSTPTYAAMKVFVDNWRWHGIPFYLRSGKRMGSKLTEIAIHFKQVPHPMFKGVLDEMIGPNVLVLRIQPDERIMLTFQTKGPRPKVCLQQVMMDFSYAPYFEGRFVDAYEQVLLDLLLGDHMLFVREDGVELTWSLITPLLEILESKPRRGALYECGSSGPKEADTLIERDGRSWRSL